MYIIEVEGISLCHLDSVGKEEIDSILDQIGKVDILMVPVGGPHKDGNIEIHTLNAEQAVNIVGEIEPRIVIPMYYKIPKLEVKLDDVDKFLKAMGAQKTEVLPKLNIKKKDLPNDGTKVILLKTG